MKVLSLRQPWAWMVANGHKPIENRRWTTHWRGEFLIHAAKAKPSPFEMGDAVDFAHAVRPDLVIPIVEHLPFWGIVGKARLVDVIPPCIDDANPSRKGLPFEGPCPRHPWHMPAQYGFVLEDIEPLPFEPLDGSLSFFDYDKAKANTRPRTNAAKRGSK